MSENISSMKKLFRSKVFWEIFHFLILILSLALLVFSVRYGISRVPLLELLEISLSYVNKFLLLKTISMALIILVHSWMGRKLDVEIDENLKQFDELWGKDDENTRKLSSFIDLVLRKYFPFILEVSLTTITGDLLVILTSIVFISSNKILLVFFDETHGTWKILLFSMLVIKFSSFRYTSVVLRIREKFMKIRKKLEAIVEQEDEIESSLIGFNIYHASFNTRHDIEVLIVKMIKAHNILLSTVGLFNKRFGFSILCFVFSSFFSLIYCGYNFFIEFETNSTSNEIIGETLSLVTKQSHKIVLS